MRDPAVVGLPRIARRVIGEIVTASPPLDSLGRRRSPASVPGYLAGRPSRNRGRRYPPDPPRTEEIIDELATIGTDRAPPSFSESSSAPRRGSRDHDVP